MYADHKALLWMKKNAVEENTHLWMYYTLKHVRSKDTYIGIIFCTRTHVSTTISVSIPIAITSRSTIITASSWSGFTNHTPSICDKHHQQTNNEDCTKKNWKNLILMSSIVYWNSTQFTDILMCQIIAFIYKNLTSSLFSHVVPQMYVVTISDYTKMIPVLYQRVRVGSLSSRSLIGKLWSVNIICNMW